MQTTTKQQKLEHHVNISCVCVTLCAVVNLSFSCGYHCSRGLFPLAFLRMHPIECNWSRILSDRLASETDKNEKSLNKVLTFSDEMCVFFVVDLKERHNLFAFVWLCMVEQTICHLVATTPARWLSIASRKCTYDYLLDNHQWQVEKKCHTMNHWYGLWSKLTILHCMGIEWAYVKGHDFNYGLAGVSLSIHKRSDTHTHTHPRRLAIIYAPFDACS